MTKILILDNDREMQTLLKLVLEREGYSPVIAADHLDALQTLPTGQYSLFIFRAETSFDAAWEFYCALKSNPALPTTGILMLLRYPMFTEENANKLRQLLKNGDEYMNYPYIMTELLGRVRNVWDQYGHPLPKLE